MGSSDKTVSAKDVMKETGLLIKQLAAAAKEFKDSPEMKAAAQDAMRAIQKTAKDFREAVAKVSQGPANQALGKEVKTLFNTGKVNTEKALTEYRDKLSKGLKELGAKVHDLADKVRKR